ncbi:hypothetical protein FCL40_11200 [Ferrimonas sediminicola]|uniref:Uncharacterized protein n=1 Tax=Ferrimonas sediminicola TaxID=2569538 RepID=A0A4U1BDN8_9GAMM|nr:hypothetical protein [Ferrimonas sediminicola]TKB48711.1 hypothetical protein FCL40_11200 [Ferrimonas sediminicola]
MPREEMDLSRSWLKGWIALIYLPLGIQMMFWMMALGRVDFSLPGSLGAVPMTLVSYYVSTTILLYPAFYLYGLFFSLHQNRCGLAAHKVMLASLIPFLSAAPYLLVGEIGAYFSGH